MLKFQQDQSLISYFVNKDRDTHSDFDLVIGD